MHLRAATLAFLLIHARQPVPAQQSSVIVQPGAPGAPTKILPADTHATVPAVAPADVDFMQGMIMHHSQAVEMTALIPSRTTNHQLQLLGAKISSSQSDEMSFMKRWLLARGQPISMTMPGMDMSHMDGSAMAPGMSGMLMPGMLSPAQMSRLRAAHGPVFDRLFLTGMVQHHNGALIMVRDLFNSPGAGQDADLFNFATDADNTQRAEIKIMQNMLTNKSH